MVDFCVYARSVLYNGLGRYDAALDAAQRAFELRPIGYGPLVPVRAGRGGGQDRRRRAGSRPRWSRRPGGRG